MGGLEIDADSRVVKKVGQNMVAIDGLYAAGEIAGGVHGNNRLGGNSLLDCVVFGRVAGKHAAKYMMGTTVPTSLAEISGALKSGGGAAAGGDAGAEGAAAPAAAAAATFELSEVASHNNKSDCWVVLHDRVLDVTDFLKDHPGGELAILTFAGKDATAEFDMIHPPDVIEKYLDPSATKGVVAGSAAAAAGGGAASAGPGAPLLGNGSHDAKAWGKDYQIICPSQSGRNTECHPDNCACCCHAVPGKPGACTKSGVVKPPSNSSSATTSTMTTTKPEADSSSAITSTMTTTSLRKREAMPESSANRFATPVISVIIGACMNLAFAG